VSIIMIMQTGLIFINKQIFSNGDISVQLTDVQESSHALLADLILLRGYLTNEEQLAVNSYISEKMPIHKQWLKKIIYGQKEQHPLVIFSENYLRLLKGLKNNNVHAAFTSRLDLFELVNDITQENNNILTLSKQRTIDNHYQLQTNIALAELITVLTLILLIFFFFTIHLNGQRQRKDSFKAKKLALFFVDYPVPLIRLSSRGNIRYYNKEASNLMKKLAIKKQQLVPDNIKKQLDKVIAHPDKTIRTNHTIAQEMFHCDIRLCTSSGQIYMMMSENKIDEQSAKNDSNENFNITA